MFEIVHQNTTHVYSLAEAQAMLPLIYRITEEASKKVKYLMACVEALPDKKSERALDFQAQGNKLVDQWQQKLERLGVRPKGLWLADFDCGDGYYCWKFPEVKILYKHGYQDGFTGRILIASEEVHLNENSHRPN